MTTPIAPICMYCTHFRPDADEFACDAFPSAIPQSIIMSEVDHRQSVKGDGGIQFEAKSKDGAEYADEVFA